MTIIEVTVSDEVAQHMVREMQAADEHPWAACAQILLRDRTSLRAKLRSAYAYRETMEGLPPGTLTDKIEDNE